MSGRMVLKKGLTRGVVRGGVKEQVQRDRRTMRAMLMAGRRSQSIPRSIAAAPSGYLPGSTTRSLSTKFKDLAAANYECSTTGSVTFIPDAIATGAGESQRVGDQIILRSLWGRGQFIAGTTTTVADAVAYIVWDRQPNKALASITDILNTASSNSFPRDSTRRRFRILKKMQYTAVGNRTTPTTGEEQVEADFYMQLPFNDCVTEYDSAGTGAIGDVISGALLLVTVGNVATGATAPLLVMGFRTRFVNP